MNAAYHTPPPPPEGARDRDRDAAASPRAPDRDPVFDAPDDDPRLALRRHTDRCFHRVEEVVPGGYIVQGFMISADEVAELRRLDADGAPLPPCEPPHRP